MSPRKQLFPFYFLKDSRRNQNIKLTFLISRVPNLQHFQRIMDVFFLKWMNKKLSVNMATSRFSTTRFTIS